MESLAWKLDSTVSDEWKKEKKEKKGFFSNEEFPAKKLSWIIQIQLLMFIAKY